MRLTEQQLSYFDTFGFLHFPGLLADRIERIIEEFENTWAMLGGGHYGKPHDGKQRSAFVPFIDQNEYLCTLIDDPRIEGIASSILGDDFNYLSSDGNFYVGDTGWHSDGWRNNGYTTIKMALYLDPLTRDTGCLRVIPGSHKIGDRYADTLQQDARQSQELWGVHGRDVPAYAIETTPGDLLLFNHNCKHAAFGGSGRRRMFTLNLYQRFREEDVQLIKDTIATRARFWMEKMYSPIMIGMASPSRLRHLEQFMAHDGHLAELTRQKKQEMAEPSRH